MIYRVKTSDNEEYGPGDIDEIVQWAREGRIPRDALLYPVEGGEPKSVFAEPRIAAILSAPPTAPGVMPPTGPKKSSSRLIPTANPAALWGYYVSVAGLLPLVFMLCPIALILGSVGVVRAIQVPESKGMMHGIVAILLSIASPVAWWYFYTHFDELTGGL